MIYEQAHAKINLALDITGKRDNGYHDVRMIMQTISITDDLSFAEGAPGSGIVLKTDNNELNDELISGGDNLILKAARLLFTYTEKERDVEITLSKRIPIAAGLGGGSADAAAALRGLNRLFNLGLTADELREIGLKVGADVPFLIEGGLCLAEGIGEILTPLNRTATMPLLICKPNANVSTAMVYSAFDGLMQVTHPDIDGMIDAIRRYDSMGMVGFMGNVLEEVTAGMHSIIRSIKKEMLSAGALGSMMSGSGPTVFGIFESDAAALAAKKALLKEYPDYFVEACRFYNEKGPHFT